MAVRLGIEPSSIFVNSEAPTPCLLTDNKMVPPTRIELVMTGYQPIVIPFNYRGIIGGA